MQEFSFTAKLAALAVGDTIYIPDDFTTKSGPSATERAVHSVKRVKGMEDRKFRTARMVAVQSCPVIACPVLLVQRIA